MAGVDVSSSGRVEGDFERHERPAVESILSEGADQRQAAHPRPRFRRALSTRPCYEAYTKPTRTTFDKSEYVSKLEPEQRHEPNLEWEPREVLEEPGSQPLKDMSDDDKRQCKIEVLPRNSINPPDYDKAPRHIQKLQVKAGADWESTCKSLMDQETERRVSQRMGRYGQSPAKAYRLGELRDQERPVEVQQSELQDQHEFDDFLNTSKPSEDLIKAAAAHVDAQKLKLAEMKAEQEAKKRVKSRKASVQRREAALARANANASASASADAVASSSSQNAAVPMDVDDAASASATSLAGSSSNLRADGDQMDVDRTEKQEEKPKSTKKAKPSDVWPTSTARRWDVFRARAIERYFDYVCYALKSGALASIAKVFTGFCASLKPDAPEWQSFGSSQDLQMQLIHLVDVLSGNWIKRKTEEKVSSPRQLERAAGG